MNQVCGKGWTNTTRNRNTQRTSHDSQDRQKRVCDSTSEACDLFVFKRI